MRRGVALALVMLLLFTVVPGEVRAQPSVNARAWALMEAGSMRVLAGNNLHQRLPMASTTKIMTALLAVESGRLDETVTVSKTAVLVEPSCIWLVPGEEIKLRDLVYGLMLKSGNDAALAVAEFLGGNVEQFAAMMNHRAQSLGMMNTNYKNPHGLHHPEHYSTAYDLARLMSYAMSVPFFREVTGTKRYEAPWDGKATPRIWHNSNRMLTSYEGADGGKTGFTRAAGRCLVATATREGMTIVSVTLNCPDDWQATARLFDYGFNNFTRQQIMTAGQYVHVCPVERGKPAQVGLIAKDDFYWPLREEEAIERIYELPDKVTAPVKAGDKLGEVHIHHRGSRIGIVPLVADQDIHRSWFHSLWSGLWSRFQLLLVRGRP